MSDTRPYVRYSDAVEVLQPDEAEVIQRVVESMSRVNRATFERHGHATRDAHAKSHGILVGTLTVKEGLPAHLRQGLFAEPREYPVVVRLSSAPGDIQSDAIASLRGLAIKVLGVPGPKVLPEHREETTQDFLLVNHPVIPFGDVKAYLKAQSFAERRSGSSDLSKQVTSAVLRGAKHVLGAVGVENETVKALGTPNTHLLGQTFHSMAALRFGDYLAKLSAAPLSDEVRRLAGETIRGDTEADFSTLTDRVVAFFREHEARYELRAQLCTDLGRMPVEDASVVWPEALSPHQAVATLTLPRQDVRSPARRVYGDDVLSFNPWHCVEAHRPLGSIMRVRRHAYEASSRFRHEMNLAPRVEPRSVSDIPA